MPDFQAVYAATPYVATDYGIDVPLDSIERTLAPWDEWPGVDLEPDFQRAHVWTEVQREAYVLHLLQGGKQGREIYFAAEGWSGRRDACGKVLIVDGKQRLESVRRWERNDLRVLGAFRSEWTGVERWLISMMRFEVADLDRPATLRWYLALNKDQTPHTAEELEKVRRLLEGAP